MMESGQASVQEEFYPLQFIEFENVTSFQG